MQVELLQESTRRDLMHDEPFILLVRSLSEMRVGQLQLSFHRWSKRELDSQLVETRQKLAEEDAVFQNRKTSLVCQTLS